MSYLRQEKLILLFASQLLALIPVFVILPGWLVVYWAVACIWRIQIARRAFAFPSVVVKVAAIIAGLIFISLSFSNVLAVEVFVSFFLVSFSLKVIELHQRSDALLLVTLNFVCLAAGFLFYQNLFMCLYAIFALIMSVQSWVALYRYALRPFWREFRFASSIVFKTLPVMLVLFVAMPRAGQLWQMPSQSRTGQTGMSDSMSPGEFNQLIQSNQVAFRVSFPAGQPVPANGQRYWRAMVFDTFDGRTWRRTSSWLGSTSFQASHTRHPNAVWDLEYDDQSTLSYSVLLEPTQERWLFTLMAPIQASSSSFKTQFTQNATIKSIVKVASRAEYKVTSASSYRLSPATLSKAMRERNLRIPQDGNSQARRYASSLREQYGQGLMADKRILTDVLAFYRSQFSYTLEPEAISSEFVDTFLFQSQRGFCEHFSSSFTYLMRAAGIPARVVVGYQGGELNPLENYLVVRQRDAHAWAEIWLEGEGWVRVDPTAAVAPSRIESGLTQAVAPGEASRVGRGFSTTGMLSWLQLRVDLLSYNWHKWVVNYGTESQSNFFKRFLGGSDPWRVATFFVVACVVLFTCYFGTAFLPKKRHRHYDESKTYSQLLSKLDKLGFTKLPGEPPMAFAQRVAEAKPQWKDKMLTIAKAYTSIAYEPASRISQAEFRQICRSWRPKSD